MKNEKKINWKELLIKYAPIIFTVGVVLLVGLSFIGPFFEIRLKADGTKTDIVYKLSDLLFTRISSINAQVFFILIFLVFPLIGCVFIFLGKFKKNFYVGSVLLFLLCAISAILSKDVLATSLSIQTDLDYSSHGLFFCNILVVVAFFLASFNSLVFASNDIKMSISDITESGILIALALVLNFIKIPIGDTGGSINLKLLPLFILALRRGPLKSFIGAGIAFGLIECLTDGYGIATYPFDYLLGMGSVAVLGFFTPLIFGKNQTTYNVKGEIFLFIGALLSTFIRFVGGIASSMVIYGYQFLPAAIYNVVYVFVSGGIAIALIMAIYGPFLKINKRFPAEKIKTSI